MSAASFSGVLPYADTGVQLPGLSYYIEVPIPSGTASGARIILPQNDDLEKRAIVAVSLPPGTNYTYGTSLTAYGNATPTIAQISNMWLNLRAAQTDLLQLVNMATFIPNITASDICKFAPFRVSFRNSYIFYGGTTTASALTLPMTFWYLSDEGEAEYVYYMNAKRKALSDACSALGLPPLAPLAF